LEEKNGGGKDWKRWEDGFRVVIDLMEGKAEAVLEQAADWREAVGAWGVLVDVQLKRDDLPYVPFTIVRARLTRTELHSHV